jgi:hypothetical protein
MIENLNKIKAFVSNPNESELPYIFAIFDGSIIEEFFWLEASLQNQEKIFQIVSRQYPLYFANKLGVIKNENNYGHLQFRLFRFLIQLSKNENKSLQFFKIVNAIVLELTTLLKENLPASKQQINFFTAEIVLELPLSLLKKPHFDFLESLNFNNAISYIGHVVVENFIPRVTKEKKSEILLIILDKLIFNYYEKDNLETRGYDGYTVSKLLNSETLHLISSIIGADRLLRFSLRKLKKAIKIAPFNFSSLSISTIEDSPQVFDTNKYDYVLVKFIRIQLEITAFSREIISSLFNSKIGIIKRLSVHSINKHYSAHKTILWGAKNINPLNNYEIKHELFMLLKENSEIISQKEIGILLDWIENIKTKKWRKDTTKDDVKNYNAMLGKEFLIAFKESRNPYKILIDNKYQELTEIYPHEREHPGYNSYFSMTPATDHSREEVSESFNTRDFEIYFSLAKKKFGGLEEKEKSKIAQRFKYLLRQNLNFILLNKSDFIDLEFYLIDEIPNYFEKAWEDKAKLNWSEVFKLIGEVIDKYINTPETLYHFIGYSAWLIKTSTKDDNNALDNDSLTAAKNLVIKLLNLRIQNERLNKDPSFDILNSTDGKIYEATVNLLLRNARLNKPNESDKWYPDIKEFYTSELTSGRQTDAMLWSITFHLSQFGYLDLNWVEERINDIFPKQNNELWCLSMQTYHKYCGQVYKQLFTAIEKGNHYDKAIIQFKDEVIGTEDVFQHIAIAYIAGWEGQEIQNVTSLIHRTLKNANRAQIHGLISFFARNSALNQSKVLKFWRTVLEEPNIVDGLVYNDLLLMVGALEKLDNEAVEIIKLNLQKITKPDILHRFLNNIFSKKYFDSQNVARVVMEIREPDFDLFYNSSEMETLASTLYEVNPELADRYVHFMLSKRSFQFLDIYNKFHSLNY